MEDWIVSSLAALHLLPGTVPQAERRSEDFLLCETNLLKVMKNICQAAQDICSMLLGIWRVCPTFSLCSGKLSRLKAKTVCSCEPEELKVSETAGGKPASFGKDRTGSPPLTVLVLLLTLVSDSASHFSRDSLRECMEHILIVMLDNEFFYGMFWIQYNWMDIAMVRGLTSSKSTSHSDKTEIRVVFSRQQEQFAALSDFTHFEDIEFLREALGLRPTCQGNCPLFYFDKSHLSVCASQWWDPWTEF